MPKLMIGCQGQWRAGPMNRIIFQPDGTQMYPIFHHSIVLSEPEAIIPIVGLGSEIGRCWVSQVAITPAKCRLG